MKTINESRKQNLQEGKKKNNSSLSTKPELLLPVGSIEAFFAAIEAGADAVYLGLHEFNARTKAKNFNIVQLAAAIKFARERNVKTYVTLNTIIRQNEIKKLIDVLFVLRQIKPDALIIQDWGVFYIIKSYFPELVIHASTQMANHNSLGLEYCAQKGIKRVVLARELTLAEIEIMTKKSRVETELFIHGALCYSFSGMCLFSSYLGGASANRGACAQPCRRIYSQKNSKRYPFSLKDNQLLEFIPQLAKAGVSSFKIEGRLKSAEYVFTTAKAYRMAIDSPDKKESAYSLLATDFGREKTAYFTGANVKNAITQAANTGLLLGRVTSKSKTEIQFTSSQLLEKGCRLRFRNPNNDRQTDFKLSEFEVENLKYTVAVENIDVSMNDEVYLAGTSMQFQSKLNTSSIRVAEHASQRLSNDILQHITFKNPPSKQELYIRVDRIVWLKAINIGNFDGVILKLTQKELIEVLNNEIVSPKNRSKIHFELPKFIAEKKIELYRQLIAKLSAKGYTSYFISHLSQRLILPKSTRVSTTENVYVFNDAAARFLRNEQISKYIYPFETDIVNLGKSSDRSGLVPLFFYPELFYSRMPVDLNKNDRFSDNMNSTYRKTVRDGITIVVPDKPVELFKFKEKLMRYGYNRFLIDLSNTLYTATLLPSLLKGFSNSEQSLGGSVFNFKRELK